MKTMLFLDETIDDPPEDWPKDIDFIVSDFCRIQPGDEIQLNYEDSAGDTIWDARISKVYFTLNIATGESIQWAQIYTYKGVS